MTAVAPTLVRTWRVGKRYWVTLTVPPPTAGVVSVASCEWSPGMPVRLNQRERRDYLRGMHEATHALDGHRLADGRGAPARPIGGAT